MNQDVADFEQQLIKLCEHWKARMTHAELTGTLDTVKMIYHIKTIENMEEPEPMNIREPIKQNSGSPIQVE